MRRGPIISLLWKEQSSLWFGVITPPVLTWCLVTLWRKNPILNLDALELVALLVAYLVAGVVLVWRIDSKLAPYKNVVEDLHDYHNKRIDPVLQEAVAEYLEKYVHRLIDTVYPTINARIHALWEIEFLRNIAQIDVDARAAVRKRVESLCNKLAGSGLIVSYFATENLPPHLLQGNHEDWWKKHGAALYKNGIENRRRLLVLDYASFQDEIATHKSALVEYIGKNKEFETQFRILVYNGEEVLRRFFDGVVSWNYAIYGKDCIDCSAYEGKVFVHHPENTIEILSAEDGRAYSLPNTTGWQDLTSRLISAGLCVSGNIETSDELDDFFTFLTTSFGIDSIHVPPAKDKTATQRCWAHNLVGHAACHLPGSAAPAAGGTP